MTDTHTVIRLAPGRIEDTGLTGDEEVCDGFRFLLDMIEQRPGVRYAVLGLVDRDEGERLAEAA